MPDLDPHETILSFVRECVEHSMRVADVLRPVVEIRVSDDAALVETELYRRLRQVADYAIRAVRPRWPVKELLAACECFVAGPLWTRVDLGDVIASVDAQRSQDSAIKLVIAAALIRTRLDDGEAITTGEAAVLAGMTRAGVIAHVNDGQLRVQQTTGRGGTYTIAAVDAITWLAQRGIAGFTEHPPRPIDSARGRRRG